MATRAILLGGVLFALCAIAGWAQAQPGAANPCAPQPQQLAAATPPAAIQPPTAGERSPQPQPQLQPLSNHEKFKVFVQYTYSPYTFVGAAFDAGMAQATGTWYSYGGGMEGYGKRYGASLADAESGAFFGRFLFPVLLHQDPRYLRSTSQTTMPRIGYALSRVLVTHDDRGKKRVNSSLILSAFAGSGMANTYYPREERSLGYTAVRAGGGLLSTAEMNVLREFWPDIRKKLTKHEPERIRRLEESPRVAKIEQNMLGPVAPPQCPAESHPEQTGNH